MAWWHGGILMLESSFLISSSSGLGNYLEVNFCSIALPVPSDQGHPEAPPPLNVCAMHATERWEADHGRRGAEARALWLPRTKSPVDGDYFACDRIRECLLRVRLRVPIQVARIVVQQCVRFQLLAVHLELRVREPPAQAAEVWRRRRWGCLPTPPGKQNTHPATMRAHEPVRS